MAGLRSSCRRRPHAELNPINAKNTGVLSMRSTLRSAARVTVLAGLGLIATAVLADDQSLPFTEGHVLSVDAIRTQEGHFLDYMKFLDTQWKQEMEAEKKAGLIVSYEVLTLNPRGPNDPDIYLVVTYKNWAAFDGLTEKEAAITNEIFGSVQAATQGDVDRGKIRRVIGTTNMQVLNLK